MFAACRREMSSHERRVCETVGLGGRRFEDEDLLDFYYDEEDDNSSTMSSEDVDNAILLGATRRDKDSDSSPTKRPKRTPSPTRRTRTRTRRSPAPTRRPPSAQRRDERDRERIVRRNTWTEDQCTGNRRSLSEVCSELNRLVCSLGRREMSSRERRVCETVGLGGRRFEDEDLVDFYYDEEDDESSTMSSEDVDSNFYYDEEGDDSSMFSEDVDSMDSEDEEDVVMIMKEE